MAKNKHSTALFEVIHSSKKPPKASPAASIPTPKWWFKTKKKPLVNPNDPTANASERSFVPRAVEPAVVESTELTPPTTRIIERIIEVPVYIERPIDSAPQHEKVEGTEAFHDEDYEPDFEPRSSRAAVNED